MKIMKKYQENKISSMKAIKHMAKKTIILWKQCEKRKARRNKCHQ